MRRLISVVSLIALAAARLAGAQTYNLTWSDEFSGSSVSSSNWKFETGGGGWGNHELEYYQSANASAANGVLTIQARKENVGGESYTSARMNTSGLHDFTFGKIEARI